jgi:DNA polymerase III epsilon subunit-like protein
VVQQVSKDERPHHIHRFYNHGGGLVAVLLIDFEATGKEPKEARILEIGAMLVTDDFEPTGTEISQLVYEPGYPALSDEVKQITGLDEKILLEGGIPLSEALVKLGGLVGPNVRYAIAFNKAYDEVLFKEELARVGVMDSGLARLFSMPWLCAMVDIESNYKHKCWRLSHLSLEYGITVNPKELHRAINDVELTRKLLKATGTTPSEMFAFMNTEWLYVQAVIQKPWKDGGVGRDKAKERGYNWQSAKGDPSGTVFDSTWVKRIKEKDFSKEEQEAPFPVRIIK